MKRVSRTPACTCNCSLNGACSGCAASAWALAVLVLVAGMRLVGALMPPG